MHLLQSVKAKYDNKMLHIEAERIAGASCSIRWANRTGSDGNNEVGVAFSAMSNELDLLASPTRQVIYDFVNCEYTFGDHLGGFFWVLPALLDGVAILVAAQEPTQSRLKSLANFIGSWLPINFTLAWMT